MTLERNDHTVAILGYGSHETTYRLLKHTRETGFCGDIYLFDNGSQPRFEKDRIPSPSVLHREEHNIYVNPAWNQIFESVNTRYLTLLNDDCFVVSPNYFDDVVSFMTEYRIALTSLTTLNVPHIHRTYVTSKLLRCSSSSTIRYSNKYRRQGWLMTMDLSIYRSCDWKIPEYLAFWYGDDWIWYQIGKNGHKAGIIVNRYAVHKRDPGGRSDSVNALINRDIENLKRYGSEWHSAAEAMWINNRIYAGSSLMNKVMLKSAYYLMRAGAFGSACKA